MTVVSPPALRTSRSSSHAAADSKQLDLSAIPVLQHASSGLNPRPPPPGSNSLERVVDDSHGLVTASCHAQHHNHNHSHQHTRQHTSPKQATATSAVSTQMNGDTHSAAAAAASVVKSENGVNDTKSMASEDADENPKEKLKKRLARKAELARASRKRKKAYVEDLEAKLSQLAGHVDTVQRQQLQHYQLIATGQAAKGMSLLPPLQHVDLAQFVINRSDYMSDDEDAAGDSQPRKRKSIASILPTVNNILQHSSNASNNNDNSTSAATSTDLSTANALPKLPSPAAAPPTTRSIAPSPPPPTLTVHQHSALSRIASTANLQMEASKHLMSSGSIMSPLVPHTLQHWSSTASPLNQLNRTGMLPIGSTPSSTQLTHMSQPSGNAFGLTKVGSLSSPAMKAMQQVSSPLGQPTTPSMMRINSTNMLPVLENDTPTAAVTSEVTPTMHRKLGLRSSISSENMSMRLLPTYHQYYTTSSPTGYDMGGMSIISPNLSFASVAPLDVLTQSTAQRNTPTPVNRSHHRHSSSITYDPVQASTDSVSVSITTSTQPTAAPPSMQRGSSVSALPPSAIQGDESKELYSLKLLYRNQVRRFALADLTYQKLLQAVRAIFATATNVTIHYVDDDGDQIYINSTSELSEAYRVSIAHHHHTQHLSLHAMHLDYCSKHHHPAEHTKPAPQRVSGHNCCLPCCLQPGAAAHQSAQHDAALASAKPSLDRTSTARVAHITPALTAVSTLSDGRAHAGSAPGSGKGSSPLTMLSTVSLATSAVSPSSSSTDVREQHVKGAGSEPHYLSLSNQHTAGGHSAPNMSPHLQPQQQPPANYEIGNGNGQLSHVPTQLIAALKLHITDVATQPLAASSQPTSYAAIPVFHTSSSYLSLYDNAPSSGSSTAAQHAAAVTNTSQTPKHSTDSSMAQSSDELYLKSLPQIDSRQSSLERGLAVK